MINNAEDFLRYTSKPTVINHKMFGKDYAAIHELKLVLILDKPIFVGFTVLDLSKSKIMTFIITLLKKILMLSCYLLIKTALLMK